ncbi:MAG: succinate dehydrogenase cytochrome b subunit [Candidatus Kapaibacterium sp.]
MPTTSSILSSTVMQKAVVAVSGLLFVLFLIGHLSGNLLIYTGPMGFNKYAQGLRDLGPLLWIFRIVLVASLALHVTFTIRLRGRNTDARPVEYAVKKPVASTVYSRSMMYTGFTILAFVVFHLAHLTWGKVQPEHYAGTWMLPDGRAVHDVYKMTVAGFATPWISLVYVVCVSMVMLHLQHAIQSAVQTLGFRHPRYAPLVLKTGAAIALVLWLGFVSIPVSVMAGLVH